MRGAGRRRQSSHMAARSAWNGSQEAFATPTETLPACAHGRQGRACCRDRTHAGRPAAVQAPLRDGHSPPAPVTSPCAPSDALPPPTAMQGALPDRAAIDMLVQHRTCAYPPRARACPPCAPSTASQAPATARRGDGSREDPGGQCRALGRRIPGPRGPRRAHAGGIGGRAGCARSDGSAASQGAGLAASHTLPAPHLPAAHRKRRDHSSRRLAYKLL